jgi:hypothetical protein
MKSTISWEVTPYTPLQVHDVSEERINSTFRVAGYAKQETRNNTTFPPKRQRTYTALYAVISQTMVHFLVTAVRVLIQLQYSKTWL